MGSYHAAPRSSRLHLRLPSQRTRGSLQPAARAAPSTRSSSACLRAPREAVRKLGRVYNRSRSIGASLLREWSELRASAALLPWREFLASRCSRRSGAVLLDATPRESPNERRLLPPEDRPQCIPRLRG